MKTTYVLVKIDSKNIIGYFAYKESAKKRLKECEARDLENDTYKENAYAIFER